MTKDQEMSVIELLVFQKALITSLEKELVGIKIENYKLKKNNESLEERYDRYYSKKINLLTKNIEDSDIIIKDQKHWILSKQAEIKNKELNPPKTINLISVKEVLEQDRLKKERLAEQDRLNKIKKLAETARLKRIKSENKVSQLSK